MTGSAAHERDGKRFPAAEPVRLVDVVAYAEAAIVSRPLAKSESTKLVAFAFDEGQELSPHSAPFDAFVQVLEGDAAITVADKTVTARAGEVVLMPAKVPHSVRALSRMKMLLTMVGRKEEGEQR